MNEPSPEVVAKARRLTAPARITGMRVVYEIPNEDATDCYLVALQVYRGRVLRARCSCRAGWSEKTCAHLLRVLSERGET